jgi:hypothetical protein
VQNLSLQTDIAFCGLLPVGGFGFRYIFVYFDVFSRFVKLNPLKAAKPMACLNKISNECVLNVKSGMQFQRQ